MTPVIGDMIESTVGKVVDRLLGEYLPVRLDEKEAARLKVEARRLAVEEVKVRAKELAGARELASSQSAAAPAWTSVLTVTHRPLWSFLMLALFVFTVLAPYGGWPTLPLTEVHKEVMQTVIIFYFGGRSVEKAVGYVWGRTGVSLKE